VAFRQELPEPCFDVALLLEGLDSRPKQIRKGFWGEHDSANLPLGWTDAKLFLCFQGKQVNPKSFEGAIPLKRKPKSHESLITTQRAQRSRPVVTQQVTIVL
jgi:hypothetical protein